jgi:hypothetical protein
VPWGLFTGVLAATPVVVATGRAVGWGWWPVGDEGVIAARSFDVLTSHPPLLGQFSQASSFVERPTYSLGPMLYWVLAVPAHVAPAALALAAGAVNAACVVGTVVLVGRRGGLGLSIAIGAGLALVTRALSPDAPFTIWNPYAALFPFVFLLAAAWSVACGEYKLLPVLVVVASYVAQAHLAYVIPTVGVLLVALGGLVIERRALPGSGLRHVRRWVIAAAVAGLVCWSAPLTEQARHRPGNMVLLVRATLANDATLGSAPAWHAVVDTVGVPAAWLRPWGDQLQDIADVRGAPAATANASALLGLAGLLALLVLATRRRRHDVATSAALGLVLCASVAGVTRGLSTKDAGVLIYSLRWASVAGMWIWLTTIWAVWALIAGTTRVHWIRAAAAPWAMVIVAVVAVWAIAGQHRQGFSLDPRLSAPAKRVAAAVPDGATARLDTPDDSRGRLVAPAIAYALRREGTRVLVPDSFAPYFGRRYEPSSATPDTVVGIADVAAPVPPGSRLLGRFPTVARITLMP